MASNPGIHTTSAIDPARQLLRHTVATIAYRGAKTVRDADPAFSTFKAGSDARMPAEILAHIGDLLEWSVGICDGRQEWSAAPPQPWDDEIARFFDVLARLDQRLAEPRPLGIAIEVLMQGPIADTLTHVGQLSLLRRLSGSPVRGENFVAAQITTGRVGASQPAAVFEFN